MSAGGADGAEEVVRRAMRLTTDARPDEGRECSAVTAIQARLQHYPNSDDKSVKKALKKWRDLSPQLFKHYAHCMHVCDASGEMRAVVEQLAPCFLIKA